MIGYPDTHPFTEDLQFRRCYRVRTVINGETGPYSAEVCTQAPPSSGPGPSVVPGPPDTGSGVTDDEGGAGLWLVAVAITLVAGLAARRTAASS